MAAETSLRTIRGTIPDWIRYTDSVSESTSRQLASALVRSARIRAHLSVPQLAVSSGVSRSVIYDIEAGRRQPSLPVLQKVLSGSGLELRLQLEPIDREDELLLEAYEQLDDEGRRRTDDRHARNVAAFTSASRTE